MAKSAQMAANTDETTGTVEQQDTAKQDKKEKVSKIERNVTMKDGSVVNFGARAKMLSTIEVESNSIIFKLETGDIFTYSFPQLAELSELFKTVILYGLRARITASLTSVTDLSVYEKNILAIIDNFNKGEFNFRGTESESLPELTLDQKVYAILCFEQGKTEWEDLTNQDVIENVLETWNGIEIKVRNKIKKNPLFLSKKASMLNPTDDDVNLFK